MNFKKSPFAIQDKNARDLDNANDYPTITDLMREKKVSNDDTNTVHHRRDLDSLGQLILMINYKFRKSPFSILQKQKREMDNIKAAYKRKVQSEIESYMESENKDQRNTIKAQDILILDKISIQCSLIN